VNKKTQSGFAHLMIVVIILAVALVGTLGFVFWQNFMQPKTDSAKSGNSKVDDKSKTTPSTDSSTNSPVATADANKGYLVLDDWGVKFKLPTNLGDNIVNYYQSNGYEQPVGNSFDSYAFTTSHQEALGGYCSHTATNQFMPIGYLSRQTSPQSSEAASGGILLGKIVSYYYYFTGSQAPCSDQDRGTDNDTIKNMLMTVEAK